MRRRRFTNDSTPEITLTPLIDTAFTILIVFMIAASGSFKALDVSVPTSASGNFVDSVQQKMTITVLDTDTVSVDGHLMPIRSLSDHLAPLEKDGFSVYVVADTLASYGDILRVAGMIREAGYRTIALAVRAANGPHE